MDTNQSSISPSPADLPGWNFIYTVAVTFRDIDMFGHVNNAAYLTYIESARVAYYTALTGLTDPREFGMTLASAKVDFLKPIFYGQTVRVYTRIGRVGNKSWTLEHEIRDAQTGELMATGSTVNVHYDYKSEQALPLPAELVGKMEAFEGRKLRDK
jgi:acyl-CoA thioester hydrolase